MKTKTKQIVYLLLAFIALGCTVNRQVQNSGTRSQDAPIPGKYIKFPTFKGDSLQYLQTNFIENKQNYQGKEFKTLLDDLELEVKSYILHRPANNRFVITGLTMSFYDFTTSSGKSGTEPIYYLSVTWETPIEKESVENLDKSNDRSWTKEHKKFFGKQIVKEIYVKSPPVEQSPEK